MDSVLPTTPIEHTLPELDENDPNTVIYYKKVNVPLEYPPTPMKEQLNQPKVYPPMMTLSKDYSPATMNASQHSPPHSSSNPAPFSPTSSPINIPQRRPSRTSSLERAGSMPTMSSSSHSSAPHLPSPPTSPWKTSDSKLTRSATMIVDETPYPNLPTDVRAWTSAHVAEYLGYSLRFYPRAITEDLGRYVRQVIYVSFPLKRAFFPFNLLLFLLPSPFLSHSSFFTLRCMGGRSRPQQACFIMKLTNSLYPDFMFDLKNLVGMLERRTIH